MSYSNTNRWITIEEERPWENANVQQESSATYPTTSFARSGLFKIFRGGTTERCIIRSMINNRSSIKTNRVYCTFPYDTKKYRAVDLVE